MVFSKMTAEKLKLPFNESGSDLEKFHQKSHSHRVYIIIGVFILVILNFSLFGFTLFYTLSRVNKLEYKVETLKTALGEIQNVDASIANALERLDEHWNILDDPSQEVIEEPKIFLEEYDEFSVSDDYPGDYDSETYDQSEFNNTEETREEEENLVKYPNDLTKEGKETRMKRSVIASTQDGVLINSESYAEKIARNLTKQRANKIPKSGYRPRTRYAVTPSLNRTTVRPAQQYNSTNHTSPYVTARRRNAIKRPSSAPVYVRRSRVKHTEDKSKAFRQVVKKSSFKSGTVLTNGENSSDPEFTIVREETLGRRRYRPMEIIDERHPRAGRVRLPCSHYNGDTSKYVLGQHINFNGNGHLRHPQRTFVDWKASDWVASAGMDAYFTLEEGILTIKEPGIYFIYAQIYYLDRHDTTGFRVHKNNEVILQCTVTAHLPEGRNKGNTCYTAGAAYLSEGDTIRLADITSGTYSLFEPGKSFFGLVKFSDIKIK